MIDRDQDSGIIKNFHHLYFRKYAIQLFFYGRYTCKFQPLLKYFKITENSQFLI